MTDSYEWFDASKSEEENVASMIETLGVLTDAVVDAVQRRAQEKERYRSATRKLEDVEQLLTMTAPPGVLDGKNADERARLRYAYLHSSEQYMRAEEEKFAAQAAFERVDAEVEALMLQYNAVRTAMRLYGDFLRLKGGGEDE